MKEITSPHNAVIRLVEQLQRKSRARKKEGLFIIEGQRELRLAVDSGYEINRLLVSSEIMLGKKSCTEAEVTDFLKLECSFEIINVTPQVYQKMAYRTGTEGCLAFAKAKNHNLNDLKLPSNPLILIAESIEKPGNVGALLRTADAAGVDVVILASPVVDLYNPNVIRSSVGGLFTNQIAIASTEEVIRYLEENNVALYAATLQDSSPYTREDYRDGTAIAVGTEATGLSETVRNAAKGNILIPMRGSIDSMNVSVSASILLFEAVRQRDLD